MWSDSYRRVMVRAPALTPPSARTHILYPGPGMTCSDVTGSLLWGSFLQANVVGRSTKKALRLPSWSCRSR